jgi:hypothetical protein
MAAVKTVSNDQKRRDATLVSRNYFTPLLAKEGINQPYVALKVAYLDRVSGVASIRVYENELLRGDQYYQMVNLKFEPVTEEPELHVLDFNPEYATDYVKIDSPSTSTCFIVPVTAMKPYLFSEPEPEPVFEQPKFVDEILSANPKTDEEPFSEQDDSHMSSMTIRDMFCIYHKDPRSNKQWLNALIKSSPKCQK